MSTRNVERELTTLFHRRAEDAMSSTDTQAERERFYDVLEQQPRTTRTTRTAWLVGAAAAALAAAGTIAVWTSLPEDRAMVPTPAPSNDLTSEADAEALAEEFVDAYLDRDLDAANAISRAGAYDDLDGEFVFNEGWYVEYDVDPCAVTATTDVAVVVTCEATVNPAHSVEVGRGPFGDVVFSNVVRNGEIIDGGIEHNHETNGLGEYMQDVADWIESHATPADRRILSLDPVPEGQRDRWVQLNREYVDAYVAAHMPQ